MTSKAKIDWFMVISQINRVGISNADLAELIKVPRPTLVGWKMGAEPRFSDGEELLRYWELITGFNRCQIPHVSVADWWAYHSC